jgi:hypothetical protein
MKTIYTTLFPVTDGNGTNSVLQQQDENSYKGIKIQNGIDIHMLMRGFIASGVLPLSAFVSGASSGA